MNNKSDSKENDKWIGESASMFNLVMNTVFEKHSKKSHFTTLRAKRAKFILKWDNFGDLLALSRNPEFKKRGKNQKFMK